MALLNARNHVHTKLLGKDKLHNTQSTNNTESIDLTNGFSNLTSNLELFF